MELVIDADYKWFQKKISTCTHLWNVNNQFTISNGMLVHLWMKNMENPPKLLSFGLKHLNFFKLLILLIHLVVDTSVWVVVWFDGTQRSKILLKSGALESQDAYWNNIIHNWIWQFFLMLFWCEMKVVFIMSYQRRNSVPLKRKTFIISKRA